MPFDAFARRDELPRGTFVVTDDEGLAGWVHEALPWLSPRRLSRDQRVAPGSLLIVDDVCVGVGLERWLQVGPVLVLIRDRDAARVAQMLGAGAADAMCAPYLVDELRARVSRLLPQAHAISQALHAAGWWYDRARREVSDEHGRRRRLTKSESIVIESLIDAAGAVVSRDALLRRIAAQPLEVKSNLVDRHVATLRAKLGDDPRNPRCVATVPGRGYRLFGDVFGITGS